MSHMRLHRVVLGLVGICLPALVACAEGDDEGQPSTGAPSAVPVKKDAPKRDEPEFNAQVTPPAAKDPSKDPAPAGGGDECVDNGDPGGSETVATQLPDTDDCDETVKTLTGRVKSAADVDMYKLKASDKWLCSWDDMTFEVETPGVELCVFVRCSNGKADAFEGCEAGSEATSEIGTKGCCQLGPGKALPKFSCSGWTTQDDSAQFSLRVRQPQGNKCVPYQVKYRF